MLKFKHKIFTAAFLIMFFSVSILMYGNDDGRTGRTLKTSTSGCGGCHGSVAMTDVSVLINGPDNVNTGETVEYSMTITKAGKTGAGLDIATRLGTLAPVSNNIRLSNGELTHNVDIPMSGGTVTILFNYTAPNTPGTDTLWSTGLATNSNGGTSGDDWNWSVSKRVNVQLPSGISSNNSLVNDYKLVQNYPNPFNPETIISYELPEVNFVSLKIFNSFGSEIASLVNEKQSSGIYNVKFNGSELASGIYFYKLYATSGEGEFTQTKSMILLK